MEDVNVHRREEISDERVAVGSRRPVARVDGVRVPVGEIQRVTEHRQSEWMRQLQRVRHHLASKQTH